MAKITFTGDDGSTQDFDLGVLTAPAVHETPTEVDVKEADGTEDTFVLAEPEAA